MFPTIVFIVLGLFAVAIFVGVVAYRSYRRRGIKGQVFLWYENIFFEHRVAWTIGVGVFTLFSMSVSIWPIGPGGETQSIPRWLARLLFKFNNESAKSEQISLYTLQSHSQYIAAIVITSAVFIFSGLVGWWWSARTTSQKTLSHVSSSHDKVRQLYDSLSDKLDRETIRIALFGRLLSYAPVYVAHGLKYFEDEGLDITWDVLGTDSAVADAVKAGDAHFGVCDPIEVFNQAIDPKKNLRILLPLSKRLDITAFAKMDLNKVFQPGASGDDCLKKRVVKILSFERPSTSYAVAIALQKQLGRANIQTSIHGVDSRSSAFRSPHELKNLLQEFDIALLWSPASDWLYSSPLVKDLREEFGCLRTNKGVSFKVVSPEVSENSGFKNWAPFSDHDGSHGHARRLMATGLLTSNDIVMNRPELCKKVFRAVTRAMIRLEGVDWSVESEGYPLWMAIKNEINAANKQYVSIDALKRLIGRDYKFNQDIKGRSIFPFIDSTNSISAAFYRDHLENLIRLWDHDSKEYHFKRKSIKEFDNEEFKKYFVYVYN